MEVKTIKRWNELTDEDKVNYTTMARTVVQFVTSNPNKKLKWETVNNWGLEHLYKFTINDYNYTHQRTQLKYDDSCIWCETDLNW